LKS
jgi:hypothetical protein